MTFEEILDQAIAMLQRRGRLTYSTLKRQFQLDDAALEDLKNELIEGQRVALDERGNVLVWTGGPEVSPRTAPPAPQPEAPPDTSDAHRTPSLPTPAVPASPDAERRQLTVLFCDLVESTALASQFDPEDLRTVVRAYQATCAEVIQRFEGYTAQYLGDGVLVYFGYPQAHEDDAHRAVRTGLGIVEALGGLNARLAQPYGVQLAVRIGIHTGVVIVGEMGSGSRQEQLALGETPNIAARLQGLATPDTVVISLATFRLVRGYFTCQDLGAHTLKGLAAPLHVHRILSASAAQSRLDVAGTTGLTPLAGRDSEVALLLERWAQSQDGAGQVVLLRGEAGIGKSRLVEVLRERVRSEGATRIVFRCSPYHQNSTLYPVIDHLQRFLQWQHEETPKAKFDRLERVLQTSRLPLEEVVPLFAALLSVPLPERYPLLTLTPQRQRHKTQEALVAWLFEEAERHPVLAVWEDLHWADPSTLDVLSLVLDQVPSARMLTLLTYRPEFRPPWATRSHQTQITLGRLRRPQVEAMLTNLTGGTPLPADVVEQVLAKTDGVPLFVEELIKMILESGLIREEADHYVLSGPLPTLAIPSTLHDSLMARLDRLSTARELAQLGAVLGREFSYELLQAVALVDETTLQQGMARLVDAELVYQRGLPPRSRYVFKHALIQEAAYQSLLKSTRQQYHQRIAQVLAERFPEVAETQPELLAQHYTEAGLLAQAIPYWQQAGQRALARSATLEAVAHLTQGLAVLGTLPDTPARAQQELGMQITLGPALMNTRGFEDPEVTRAYARARELCQQVGTPQQLFQVLWGVRYWHQVRGQSQRAREVGEELLGLAQQLHDPVLFVEAHRAQGNVAFWQGEFVLAHAHVQHALARYDPQQMWDYVVRYGQNPGVFCRLFGGVNLWLLGYPTQALQWSEAGLTHARELGHAYTLQQALCFSALLHLLRREAAVAQKQAEAQRTLCTEHGFAAHLEWGTIEWGAALAVQGAWGEGLTQMRQGLTAYQTRGRFPWLLFLGLLAEACGRAGQVEEGLQALEEALQATEERMYEAEVYRLKGELLQQSAAQQGEAEASLHQALTVARRQQAKSLELRAAMTLSRLWRQQGKHTEAYELLAPIYGWFTEGFDTADLQEAKALLEALA